MKYFNKHNFIFLFLTIAVFWLSRNSIEIFGEHDFLYSPLKIVLLWIILGFLYGFTYNIIKKRKINILYGTISLVLIDTTSTAIIWRDQFINGFLWFVFIEFYAFINYCIVLLIVNFFSKFFIKTENANKKGVRT